MKGLHKLARLACLTGIVASLMMGVPGLPGPQLSAGAEAPSEVITLVSVRPSVVTVEQTIDGSFQYHVNGVSQTFIGIGYNPIYRDLPDEERASNYDRDFTILCEAGVNHITGWDTDKGFEQDKFDEITLDHASKHGLGVVMPFYLPPDGHYEDEEFIQTIMEDAKTKIIRFKDFPALKMWGVGNEVLSEMVYPEEQVAFSQFYVRLVDMFHELDPQHPVIYREAEDGFATMITQEWGPPEERPWLLYGTNVYTMELDRLINEWPYTAGSRPLLVTEFGAEPGDTSTRAEGYLAMWRMIRSHPEYVLGGAPYVWTTDGPEPTDSKWGLMDLNGQPVDETFNWLAAEWRKEGDTRLSCGYQAQPLVAQLALQTTW